MKIYTKTGDDGTTALFDGTRISKDALRVRAYGTLDELNACLGMALAFLKDEATAEGLREVQKDLFALGAHVANPLERKQNSKSDFPEDRITRLEKSIDQMEARLKPLTRFILPGGAPAGATLHLARTVCRRAETLAVSLSHTEKTEPIVVRYLNRLSDFLFVAARFANHLENREETLW